MAFVKRYLNAALSMRRYGVLETICAELNRSNYAGAASATRIVPGWAETDTSRPGQKGWQASVTVCVSRNSMVAELFPSYFESYYSGVNDSRRTRDAAVSDRLPVCLWLYPRL